MYILCSITVLLTFKPAYKSTALLCRSCAFQDIETFLDNPMFANGAHGTKCKFNGSPVPPGRKLRYSWQEVTCHLAGCPVPPGRKLLYSWAEVMRNLAGSHVPAGTCQTAGSLVTAGGKFCKGTFWYNKFPYPKLQSADIFRL